jgi:hypothetical protein
MDTRPEWLKQCAAIAFRRGCKAAYAKGVRSTLIFGAIYAILFFFLREERDWHTYLGGGLTAMIIMHGWQGALRVHKRYRHGLFGQEPDEAELISKVLFELQLAAGVSGPDTAGARMYKTFLT